MSFKDEVKEALREVVREELPTVLRELARPLAPANDVPAEGEPLAVSTETAARLLDQEEKRVREWCNKGIIRAAKKPGGRAWIIPYAELKDFLRRNQVGDVRAGGDIDMEAHVERLVRRAR